MKQFVAVLVLFMVLLVLVLGNADAETPHIENIYPLCGHVIEVNYTENIVTVIDGAGVMWAITECEDWQVGDIVAMIMFDNFTPIIFDDIILDYKYCGYCADW